MRFGEQKCTGIYYSEEVWWSEVCADITSQWLPDIKVSDVTLLLHTDHDCHITHLSAVAPWILVAALLMTALCPPVGSPNSITI